MNNAYQIRSIGEDALLITKAMDLVWRVFSQFEAPEYSEQGIREFKDFVAPPTVQGRMAAGELFVWGCFAGDDITGVIATRPPCHISLLFVDPTYHRQGIARALYETVLDDYRTGSNHREMTVHSSPYAQQAYRRLGFADTAAEQAVNGLRFIPMKHIFR